MDKKQCEKLILEKAKEIYAIYKEYNPDDDSIFVGVSLCEMRGLDVSISIWDSFDKKDRINADYAYNPKEDCEWQKDSSHIELSAKLEEPTFAMFAANLSPKARKRIMRRGRTKADISADGII